MNENGAVVTHFESRNQSSLSQALKKNAMQIAAKEQQKIKQIQKEADEEEPEFSLRVILPLPRNNPSALTIAKKAEII